MIQVSTQQIYKSFIWEGSTLRSNPYNSTLLPVADPDLQIRVGGTVIQILR